MSKVELRREYNKRRQEMPEHAWREKSRMLCEKLAEWLRAQSYDRIALYRSFRREPDLAPFENLWDKTQLYYPKTGPDGSMEFYRSPSSFLKGRFGIEEPDGTTPLLIPDPHTLLLVPGLAYDRHGHRLGYGGGYYDRYLQRHPCPSLGICFSDFLLPALPSEAHDQRVSHVFTEAGIC